MDGYCIVDVNNQPLSSSWHVDDERAWVGACLEVLRRLNVKTHELDIAELKYRGYRLVPATMNPIIEDK